MDEMDELAPGTQIGDYTVVRRLGSPGGQGTVYKVKNNIKKPFALKMLNDDSDHDDAWEEAQRILDAEGHPNIVGVVQVNRDPACPYVVMDYVHGVTLEKRLKDVREMSTMQWWRIMKPLLHGLDHIHGKGVVHCDIKPANIVIRQIDESPVLVDFGGARTAGRLPGERVGTQPYACPETWEHGNVAQAHFDLFSVAVMSFEAIFGPVPTKDDDDPDTDAMRYTLWNNGTDGFFGAIAEAIAPQPAKRPQSVVQWLGDMLVPPALGQDPPVDPGQRDSVSDTSDTRSVDFSVRSDHAELAAPGPRQPTVSSLLQDIAEDFGLPPGAVKLCDPNGNAYPGMTHVRSVRESSENWQFEKPGYVRDSIYARALMEWIEHLHRLPPRSVRFFRSNGREYAKTATRTQIKALRDDWRSSK